MTAPSKIKRNRKTRDLHAITTHIPKADRDKLDAIAKKKGMTRYKFLAEIVLKELSKHKVEVEEDLLG